LCCLDSVDALAIAKQKIFDLALYVDKRMRMNKSEFSPTRRAAIYKKDFVLNIKCDPDHLVEMPSASGKLALRNCIVEMVKTELGLNHYYIGETKTLLVHVDRHSINIPPFQEVL
jgi:hypothetical protein